MKSKISTVFGRIPTSLKKKFINACRKLKTTQQYVLVDAINNTIKKANK